MFSRMSKPIMPSFVISNKKGEPKAIFISDEHATDPEIRKLLKKKAKQGKLHSIEEWSK